MKSLLRKCKIATLPISIFILGFTSVVSSASVVLLDNTDLGVTAQASQGPDYVTNFTSIDLNDSANFLAVVTTGEVNIDSISFGGQSMTKSSGRDQGIYTDITIYTLFSPNFAAGQTLSVQYDTSTINAGFALQYFTFNNVSSIGDAPNAGSDTGSNLNLDFGSVTAGSYLLMAGADNNGSIAFSAEAPTLHNSNGSGSGWDSTTAGVSLAENSVSAIYSATSTQRMGIAGLELIAVPEPSSVALVGLASMLLLLRRYRHD